MASRIGAKITSSPAPIASASPRRSVARSRPSSSRDSKSGRPTARAHRRDTDRRLRLAEFAPDCSAIASTSARSSSWVQSIVRNAVERLFEDRSRARRLDGSPCRSRPGRPGRDRRTGTRGAGPPRRGSPPAPVRGAPVDRTPHRRTVRAATAPVLSQGMSRTRIDELVDRKHPDVDAVEVCESLFIEEGRRDVDVFEAELLDHLFDREDLALVMRCPSRVGPGSSASPPAGYPWSR